MTNAEALQAFIALRLHFTKPSYDYFKYDGRLKNTIDVSKRKDKYQIARIAKHPDPVGLIVANLTKNYNLKWTGDIISNNGLDTYKKWQARIESLSYTFKEELNKLNGDFNSNFKVVDGQQPYALRLFIGDHISLETLVILDSFLNFYPHWEKQLVNDIIWNDIKLLVPKYRPFFRFDRKKCYTILHEHLSKDK